MNTFNLSVLTENADINNIFDISLVEETYFYSALKYVEESRAELRNETKILYRSILESNMQYEVLNESFQTFFDKVKEIIAKFIKFVKSLIARFITALHKLVLSDKYIRKNKEEFSKFKSEYEFDITGYEYTFSPTVPVINALAEFKKDFVGLDFEEIVKKNDPKDMTEYIVKKYEELTKELNTGDFYDKCRGEVLGKDTSISSSDFHGDIFAEYRNGADSKETITINSSEVIKCLVRFEDYKKHEKDTKKLKSDIEKQYKEIESKIKNMLSKSSEGDLQGLLADANGDYTDSNKPNLSAVPKDVINKIDLYIKAVVGKVVEMSNIHSLAFSLKMDAIVECYKQDKEVLYRALSAIQKKSYKEEGAK